jgi:hypothetical protein
MNKRKSTRDLSVPAPQGAHPLGGGGELHLPHLPAQGGHPPLTPM